MGPARARRPITSSTSCGWMARTSPRCRWSSVGRCSSTLPLAAPLELCAVARRRASRGNRRARSGWEGVIAKRLDAPYEGRRSPALAEDEVRGQPGTGGRRIHRPEGHAGRTWARCWSATSPRRSRDDFVFAGKVGTGFDTKLLLDLRARLNALEIPSSPFTKATRSAARGRPLGAAADRRAGRVHRMDRPRQAAAFAPARRPSRQVGPRGRERAAVITHPEKVLFPEDGITKGELAAYYESIAPAMLPHIRLRPVTMERFPAGIDKDGFLQKDVSKGYPAWLRRIEVPKKGGTVHHPLVTDTRSLLWLANQNCITPHVWTSREPALLTPDLCVFDLDPSEEAPDILRAAVLGVRALLEELGLPCWVKTSGSKGFHVVVPLDGKAGFDDVAGFAHAAGRRPGRARSRTPDAGVQQSRSRGADSRRHRAQSLRGHRGGGVRRAGPAGRSRVGPVHVGGNRVRRRRAQDVHVTRDGRPRRGGRRPVGGPAPSRTVADASGAAAETSLLIQTMPWRRPDAVACDGRAG